MSGLIHRNIARFMRGRVLYAALLSLVVTGCATAGYDHLATSDRRDIHRVETYLNGLTSIQAQFAQDGPEQQQGDGHFFYVPGRFEMVYDVPHATRAVARDGHLILRNDDNGAVTHLSLKRNPMGLLLKTPIHFDKDVQVTQVARGEESLQVSLAEANDPSQGLLTLQFSDVRGKLSLIGIQGVDGRHHHFGLSLFDVKENQPVEDSHFIPPA